MNRKICKLVSLVKGYIREEYGIEFPCVLKSDIARYSMKNFETEILTYKEDIRLFELLNQNILVTYDCDFFKIYDEQTRNCNSWWLDQFDTITLITTTNGDKFAIYLNKPWGRALGGIYYDPKAFIYYMDPVFKTIRFSKGCDLEKKITKSFPLMIKDILKCRTDFTKFEIWTITKYRSRITHINQPIKSRNDDDSDDNDSNDNDSDDSDSDDNESDDNDSHYKFTYVIETDNEEFFF